MENLAENNRLIAEFMRHITSLDSKVSFNKNCAIQDLKYHSDWNWLMEVVNDITTEDDFQTDYPDNILFWEAFNQIDLETTYMACIDFIKWHNEQK